MNHKRRLAQRALLSERIGESAPLPGSTLALSTSLCWPHNSWKPWSECASSPCLGNSEHSDGSSSTYKECLGGRPATSQPPQPAQSSLENPYPFLPLLTSTVLIYSPPFALGWMAWRVSWLTALSLPISVPTISCPCWNHLQKLPFGDHLNRVLFSLPSSPESSACSRLGGKKRKKELSIHKETHPSLLHPMQTLPH